MDIAQAMTVIEYKGYRIEVSLVAVANHDRLVAPGVVTDLSGRAGELLSSLRARIDPSIS